MPINNLPSGKVPADIARRYRNNWVQILPKTELDAAFSYLYDGRVESATSFEMASVDIPQLLAPGITGLRVYPGAVSLDLQRTAPVPVFVPLLRTIRKQETTGQDEFSDYFLLYPVDAPASTGLEPAGLNSPQAHMAEITTATREQYRQDWQGLRTADELRGAFYNRKNQRLNFHHFDTLGAAGPADHLRRLVELAVTAGADARFYLHLGYAAVAETDREDFGVRSLLEVRDENGDSANFDDSGFCPPWCDPPQDDE